MDSGVFFNDYASDMGLRRMPAQKVRIALAIAFVLIAPWFANNFQLTLLNQIGIAAIGAIGLNILVGYTGQISLGQGGFMAVGAYTAGVLAKDLGLPFYVTIPIACFVTAIIGGVFGIPSLRLKGLYLAIATLAAQQIINWIVTNWEVVTGGVDALVLPTPHLFSIRLSSEFSFYWVILFCLVLTIFAASNLMRSRVGRAFIAIRDQDIAAEVMGVNVFQYKVLAFATSSFFVGLSGALTAHWRTIISWERFTIDTSILFLAMIIIGGLGSISGSIYGAAFMTLLPAILNNIGRGLDDVIPAISRIIPFLQQAMFGLVIVLFLIFEPEGLAKIWRNIKDYFRLWPFSY